jgi:hypothetical protein
MRGQQIAASQVLLAMTMNRASCFPVTVKTHWFAAANAVLFGGGLKLISLFWREIHV